MASASSTRYCAKGERCALYDPVKGKPAKLNRYSTDTICTACREKERDAQVEGRRRSRSSATRVDKPQLHKPPEEGGKVLSAGAAEDEIRRLKYEMVISLSARRGLFWRLIKEAREYWGIEPTICVPSSTMGPIDPEYPLRDPNPYLPATMPDPYDERVANSEFTVQWNAQLGEIYQHMIPEESPARGSLWDWGPFLAACILYDPPHDALLEFVAVGGPEPKEFYGDRAPEEFDPSELPRMLAPPIKTLQELRGSVDWARDCILHWVGEILDSPGMDPVEMLALIERHDPDVHDRYRKKVEQDSDHYFIEVTGPITWDDLRNTFSAYLASQEERPKSGAQPRDQLIAYQCWLLHDRYEYTYKELAERYDLGSVDTAKRYVKDGREAPKETREQ